MYKRGKASRALECTFLAAASGESGCLNKAV